MANTYLYNLSDTWNTLATVFTAIKMNVTDTQSNAASKLLDLQVSANTKFNVGKRGNFYANVSLTSAESDAGQQLDLNWNTTANVTGIFVNLTDTASGTGSLLADFQVGGTTVANMTKAGLWSVSGLRMVANTDSIAMGSDNDVVLEWEASDVLALRRSTNAQEFRIYNTYTDASNYERAEIDWDTNVFRVRPTAAGTGTVRDLALGADTSNTIVDGAAIDMNSAVIMMADLPTSDPSVAGQLWNNSGVLTVSAG